LFGRIATELSVKPEQVQRTVALLLDDATVPFIARYRKEATGNLDEEQIRHVAERHKYYQELEQRRTTILTTLTEQGKLSNELREQILACFNKVELEDLYLPYRPKRQTRASVALERGLEPLARFLWEQQPGAQSIPELAVSFVDPEKGVVNVDEALAGAGHIIAEWIAERADVRQVLRSLMFAEGKVRSTVAQGKQDHKTKFQDYYDFQEAVATIPSHRMLAILRGVREDVLSMVIEADTTKALGLVQSRVIREHETPFVPYLLAYCEDAYHRLLFPSLQTEVRKALKERADAEAITVFQGNLRNLLMAAPLGTYGVLGIDHTEKDETIRQEGRKHLARRVMRFRASQQQQRIGFAKHRQRVEIVQPGRGLVHQMLDAEFPCVRKDAGLPPASLIAGPEEMESDTVGDARVAVQECSRGGQDSPQRRDAKRQERPRVADVGAAIGRNQTRSGGSKGQRVVVTLFPADWDFLDDARRTARSGNRVLIGACRYGGDRICMAQYARLEPFGQRSRRAAPRIDAAAGATTHVSTP